MESHPQTLPLIDITPLMDPLADLLTKQACATQIDAACRQYGFFRICGHGVDPNLQIRLDALSREFFNLPREEKEQISMQLGGSAWRGWFPVGDELTSGKPDHKEGLYLGQELPSDHPRVIDKTPLHGKNLFP
jgi:isopenicillin N synthase-like dioxygenase